VWTAVTTPVQKIAHYVTVTNEALADYANFEAVVRGELTAGLINAENAEVLSGSGVAPHLAGLTAASGILTYAPATAEARWRSILHAIQLLRSGTAFAQPNAVIVHPADYELVAATLTTGSGELLVTSDPTGAPTVSLWGVPFIQTTQIAAGTALVADLATGAVVFEREPARIFVDPYSASTTNEVKFVCEERLALGVTRPDALCVTTFNGTT
jgi:HK97 family phage major capsid protein